MAVVNGGKRDRPDPPYLVGILAYGSLIADPGPELGPSILVSLLHIETPFCVEYARASRSRGGAPTLVPVEHGGARVRAVIHVLREGVGLEQASDWLWRREVRRYGSEHYRPKPNSGTNAVVVESLIDFAGVARVLYTRIGANITPLTGEELARRAVRSAESEAGRTGLDGISYLIEAKRHGILTPLTADYEQALLRLTQSSTLQAAIGKGRGAHASPSRFDRKEIVLRFCQECVWARSVRTHFAQLFESGDLRHALLAETARTFFHDLNLVLLEYVLLQQCKLTDPATSGGEKENLTSNYLLGLSWTETTRQGLKQENQALLHFRAKVVDARRRLVAHTDLRTHLSAGGLGSFTEADEEAFWQALQRFVDLAHEEAVGGPFEIDASMPDGDAASLLHRLADAIDYEDVLKDDEEFFRNRIGRRRYDQL